MTKISNWLKTKPATAGFSIVALLGGFLFLNHNLTGNIIAEKTATVDLLSLTGILLIVCSFILALYSTKKR